MKKVINFLNTLNPRFWVGAVMCCFFLFDFQQFRKYFKNIFEKVCTIKISVVYLYQKLKQTQNEKRNHLQKQNNY
jgi:hypothetical protein